MQTTINQVVSSGSEQHLLRSAMTVDGTVCAISGVLVAVLAQPIAAFMGVQDPIEIVVLGLVLMATAVFIYFSLRDKPIRQASALGLIALNAVWVVASVALALEDPFHLTSAAKVVILIQAFLTADVAFVEWLGLRQAR